MKRPINLRKSVLVPLLASALFISGCSSSNDSGDTVSSTSLVNDIESGDNVGNVDLGVDGSDLASGPAPDGASNETNNAAESTSANQVPTITTPEQAQTTRVTFDITVPKYVSNALQVGLVWGDRSTTANWVVDESWTVVNDFPMDALNTLVVTFSDDNGALSLGVVETEFRTGTNAVQSFQITADQFNTEQFDSDQDGTSNLDEVIAGDDPLLANLAPSPAEVDIEFVAVKTFRISWQSSEGAEFYRVLENKDGLSGFTDISGDLAQSTNSFDHRVALFARANAQYLVQSCNDDGCVDSVPVSVTGLLENAIGYLKAGESGLLDHFGASVSLSADGNIMAVGMPDVFVSGNPEISGAVTIFELNSNTQWQQQAYIRPQTSHQKFGHSVSLSADGTRLAVGGMDKMHVYKLLDNGEWGGVYPLKFDGGGLAAVAMSADGNTFAFNVDGLVWVYVHGTNFWEPQERLPETFETRNFRVIELSLSADGNTLAVGWNHRFRVYARSNGQWQDQTPVSLVESHVSFGQFVNVSLSADGNTLAVGAQGDRSAATGIDGDQLDQSADHSGAVFIYERSNSSWEQGAYIKASNTEFQDSFGSTTSLSADGNTLAVGAVRVAFSGEDSSATGINGNQSDNSALNSGAAYVFTRSSGLWRQQAYIKATNTDESDFFGSAISLSADGQTLAVGARGEDSSATGFNGNQDDNTLSGAGAVYLY